MKKNTFPVTIAAICFVLFFIGGPGYDSPRSYKYFWDLGHILFFAIFTWLILTNWPKILKMPFYRQAVAALVITIIAGSLVELAQTASFRNSDLLDVARDVIGCLVALAFWVPGRRSVSARTLKIFQTTTVGLVLVAVLPLAGALIDETQARSQFPVLADFESPFEKGRWSGDADFTIDHKIHFHGGASLKVIMNTSKYSGVALKYFPGNWQGCDQLQLSIYNPDPKPIQLTCRIHDRRHTRGPQRYEDRFNRRFCISTG